jgi:hypothetical protein
MIMLVGGFVVGFGLVGTIEYVSAGYSPEHPFNLGIILGYGSHMIAGTFAVLIADHLIKIEKRLDKIESGGDPKPDAEPSTTRNGRM